MVRHIVCYKLTDNSEEKKKETQNVLLSMKNNVPMLKSIEVGTDFFCSDRSFDVALIATFESREDYNKYLEDDYHNNVVMKHTHSVACKTVIVDFDF